jgi:hypothetical protein
MKFQPSENHCIHRDAISRLEQDPIRSHSKTTLVHLLQHRVKEIEAEPCFLRADSISRQYYMDTETSASSL